MKTGGMGATAWLEPVLLALDAEVVSQQPGATAIKEKIADVFVVNKADREGADRTARALTAMLDLGNPVRRRDDRRNTWRPPVLKTVAADETGIAPLAEAIDRHAEYLKQSGQFAEREREQIGDELRRLVARALLEQHLRQVGDAEYARAIEEIAQRKLDPHAAAQRLVHVLRTEATL